MSVDIERTYGQRKLLAQRLPIMPRHKKSGSTDEQLASPVPGTRNRGHVPTGSVSSISSFTSDQTDPSTPAPTEGDTATEAELETEGGTDVETNITPPSRRTTLPVEQPPLPDGNTPATPASQHDLMNSYFRKDTLLISNIDLLR
jgi:phosphatidylethanolamine N-methyltransferase